MFLPILGYADGYGFTYGGRVSTIDLLGAGERLSVPLTWGGTKRAAIEFERTLQDRGPSAGVLSSFGIWNRENPHYEIDDQRVELKGRVERQFAHVVRVGLDASRSSVEFGTRMTTSGRSARTSCWTRERIPHFPRTRLCWAPDGRN